VGLDGDNHTGEVFLPKSKESSGSLRYCNSKKCASSDSILEPHSQANRVHFNVIYKNCDWTETDIMFDVVNWEFTQNMKENPDLFHRTQVQYVDFLRSSFLPAIFTVSKNTRFKNVRPFYTCK
jgi:hypothetical protein